MLTAQTSKLGSSLFALRVVASDLNPSKYYAPDYGSFVYRVLSFVYRVGSSHSCGSSHLFTSLINLFWHAANLQQLMIVALAPVIIPL